MTIEKRISKARTMLLLDHPWFGSLAMNLRIVPEPSIQTFDVDGSTMRYNPEFAESLNNNELAAVIAHEVMHCALLHIYRRNGRDMRTWNMAADYAINQELVKSGLQLPQGCLLDSKYKDLSAEVIYAQIKREQQQQPKQDKQGQSGNGNGQPTGEFLDAPTDGDGQASKDAQQGQESKPDNSKGHSQSMTEQDWQIAAEQAAKVAKGAGKMPGGLERVLQSGRETKVDWKAELRDFLEQTQPSDYSWASPNKRFAYQGLYLPSTVKENVGKFVIAIDTSGSINQQALEAFASEVNAICSDVKPEGITVLYCDTRINRVQESEGDEEIKLTPCGGGGTAFTPVFDYISKLEEQPKALLYFTDLECYDHPTEPEYPTLWVTGLDVTKPAPFGKAIRIEL